MNNKASAVSTVSDLTSVPLTLTVKDELVTLHLHHLMVSDDTSSQEFIWKGKPVGDRSKACSHQQMSKALHLLLPYPVLCASKAERVFLYQKDIQPNILDALPGLSQNNITFQTYLSGSKGENLDIPLTFSLDGELNIKSVSKSDLDLLIIMPMQPQEADRKIVDTENTHPGYFRCLGKETILARGVSEFVFQQSQLVGQIHGPSILANTPMKEVDHVLAFQFHGWPGEAEDFHLRNHPSGWPSEEIVKDIVNDGCHMVLKSHPFTDKNVKNEFRYSFSLAEKRLAASFSKPQRFVFMFLKLLHQENFNCRDVIASYHMKTIMFWECEEVPPEDWTSDNEATRLLSLLDRLLRHLRERNLPSFFIPDNNLIDHIPTESINHLQTVVTDIRANLMRYIMTFIKQNRFLGYPLSLADDTVEEIGRFATKTEADMAQAHMDLVVQNVNNVGQQTDPKPSHRATYSSPLSIRDQAIDEINRVGMKTKSEDDMVQAHVDLAVRCAALHVADFYLCEKTVLDTTLYFMQPGEGTLAAHLIRCYLHNILIPLRSAFYILKQAWPGNEPEDTGLNESKPESTPSNKQSGCSTSELQDQYCTEPETEFRGQVLAPTKSEPEETPQSCQESESIDKLTCRSGSKEKLTGFDSECMIWECLTSFGDCVSANGLSMVEDNQTEKLIQQFLDHELPDLKTAVQNLQTIPEANMINIEVDPNDSTSKLQTARSVLLHLVAYCFIIVNSNDGCTTDKFLQRIQNLQGRLAQVVGLEDLSYCCKQLHAFSVLYLGHNKEVEEILLSSTLKPTAASWLKKLLSAKQESTATKLSSSKWAWEWVSLTTYNVKMNEEGSAFIEKWLEHQPYSQTDFSCATSVSSREKAPDSESSPVGRLHGTHDRTYWDSCMMRWELDTAQNLLVPEENLLRQSLQSMVEDLLTADQGAGTALDAMHPSCTLIVAKYLLLNKDTDKAVILLDQIQNNSRSVVDCYRVFPLEVRLMLDDRVLAGRNLRRKDHFDFSIIMYALYLLVRAYLEKGDLCAAQMKVDEMTRLCEKDLSGELGSSYPWQVSANNLTLLGTAQNMCGNKASSLMAFVYAELVSWKQTQLTQCPLGLNTEGRTSTEAVTEGISVLSSQLNVSSAEAFRVFLGVLYPEADLSTALARLVSYCTEGGSLHEEYCSVYETISGLSDQRPSKFCRKV